MKKNKEGEKKKTPSVSLFVQNPQTSMNARLSEPSLSSNRVKPYLCILALHAFPSKMVRSMKEDDQLLLVI